MLDRSHVSRKRLVDALSATGAVPLVLVSGPAGSGKTSLVAEWARLSGDTTTGWVTFEDGDSTFWPHVLECLRQLGLPVPTVRAGESDDLLVGRKNVVAVGAAMVDSGATWTLVLDGYELASLPLAREVDLLIRRAGGHLRLLLVGRVDPVLPMYRYRLAGDVAEVRCADLAFTDVEAARLLTRLGVTLSAESVHELNDRIEGWAAGLVFAARALSAAPSAQAAVASVLEQPSDINEYLVGEVLDVQSAEMRDFLLGTSIVDIVAPGLVEELLGPEAGRLLPAAARANVFMESTPERAGTYRYFPFFRDLLRSRLDYEAPGRVHELHRRAARWYRNEGDVEHSFQHLALAGAWQDMCKQVVDDGLVGRVLLEGSTGGLRSILARLPDDVMTAEASLVRAAVALSVGDHDGCGAELDRARSLGGDDPEGGAWALTVSLVDASRGCITDDVATADRLTRGSERRLSISQSTAEPCCGPPPELHAVQAMARGVSLLRRGSHDEALASLARAASADAVERYPHFRARCWGYVAAARALRGEFSAADRASAQALMAAAEGGSDVGWAVAKAHATLALVAVERHDAATARRYLTDLDEPPALAADPVHHAVVVAARAGLERMDGQTEEAGSALLALAEHLSTTDWWLSDVLRAAAARVALGTGRPRLALEVLGDLGPSTVVVAAAARAELGETSLATELAVSTPEAELPLHGRVSKLLVEALVAAHSSSAVRARALIDESLRLAAPEGLREPFRQAGPALTQLLTDNSDLLLEHRWLTDPTAHGSEASPPRDAVEPQTRLSVAQPALIEPLTPKELEVLRHLEHLLTTEEIAEQMFVSVNTVRTHVRSVLRKLGVNRRNAAIRRARELGMISA